MIITSTAPNRWFLYLLECRNGHYYAGITNDLEARFAMHLSGKGARYTRANPPIRLLGSRSFPDRASATRAECHIKQLPRTRKIAFLDESAPIVARAQRAPGTRGTRKRPNSATA
jgi:putative endonuclease